MKRLHILNPVSGAKRKGDPVGAENSSNEERYVTQSVGDCERHIYETCLATPETHFVVYGGDGTVSEAVGGIVRAGAGEKALLSVVPSGTGNDFVRSFPEKGKILTVDALKVGDRYAANIVNFGFDSRVVAKTQKYKKIFPGSAAYVIGVADTLFHKIGESWQIELELENGEIETYDEIFTLALCANCQYYGGGFRAAPLADPADGLIDFIAVRKVSRATFIRLVGSYKKGTHLDPETKKPYPKFEKYLLYRRCRRVKLTGIRNLCADGEIEERSEAEITVVPSAIRIST